MEYYFKFFEITLEIFEIFFENFGNIPRDSPKFSYIFLWFSEEILEIF